MRNPAIQSRRVQPTMVLASVPAAAAGIHDRDISGAERENRGYLSESTGSGTAWLDSDRDGDCDLFIANGHIYPQVDGFQLGTSSRQNNPIFVNKIGRFLEVSAASGLGFTVKRSFRSVAFGDFGNDGDVDAS